MPARKKKPTKSTPRSRKSRAKRASSPAVARRPAVAGRSGSLGKPAAAALVKVRRACLALPDTTEKIAWGSPTFRVNERLFVMFMDNHHGDGRLAIWCNAAPGAQEAFVTIDAESYFVPPYVGPSGWLGVRLDRTLAWSEVAARIGAAREATLMSAEARRRRVRRSSSRP
ncbi:MAG TPA: MmcQ/YjbR family DNA-binding protein [Candidatus Polarisedimenticolia bacterium]|nr:MmcQ/YjbR family DNA-binding protein [Candidatus Polarisedimenticolia bacterium]